MLTTTPPKLSLGPVPYYWPRGQLLDFYERMAQTPVDIVYIGETVCPKRRALRREQWLELAQWLEQAGKEVVLSSLTLIESGSDLALLKRLCRNGRFMVEANDMGAVGLLAGQQPFVSGPSVNVYNAATLDVLARQGLKRWVLPVELSQATLRDMQRQRPPGVETEVLVFGRLPLAYSARCFTARAHNLPKDDCQFRCLDYPDGLLLSTRETHPFLVLNGIQIQSARSCNLIDATQELVDLKVDVLRISPQARHTERVIQAFHARLHGSAPQDGSINLDELTPSGSCNGYWHGTAGMAVCDVSTGIEPCI